MEKPTITLTFLGTGTSTGVPEVGCCCEVCHSTDPRDKRLRCSALIDVGDTRLLIDCGPDFRQQLMPFPLRAIDAVLVTHEHYDHVGGLDDLRPFCRFGEIPVYANELTADHLRMRMPYCFVDKSYPGIPRMDLRIASPGVPFAVKKVEVMPLEVMHGKLSILGYRIGQSVGYVTDMLTMPEASYQLLEGVELLVLNALREKPHPTHQTVSEALRVVERLKPRETYLIHPSHHIGLHACVEQQLPPHVHLAYDGLCVQLSGDVTKI